MISSPLFPVTLLCHKSAFKLTYLPFFTSFFRTSTSSPIWLLLFYIALSFGCNARSQLRATYHCFQVSMSGPLLPNLCRATLTPPPPLSTTISSSPQGQHSAPSRLKPPIMSTSSSHLPPSFTPLLTHPPTQPLFQRAPFCLPHLGLVQSFGHQSQHVRQPVLMEYGVRALRVAEVEASRDPPPLFFFLSLSVPPSLPVWLMTHWAFEQRWMYRTTWTENKSSLAWSYGTSKHLQW